MSKGLKYGILIFGIVIITIVEFIGFGLYSMKIEDHYGDYQTIYYESKNSDIIVNEETSEFGIVGKNWKRLNIWTKLETSENQAEREQHYAQSSRPLGAISSRYASYAAQLFDFAQDKPSGSSARGRTGRTGRFDNATYLL